MELPDYFEGSQMRSRIKIEWYIKNPSNPFDWTATPIDITSYVIPNTLRVRTTIVRNGKSTFSFSVWNPKGTLYDSEIYGGGFVNVGDKIMIYRWTGERESTDSDLIFDGIITKIQTEKNVDNQLIKVTGESFSTLAFGALVSFTDSKTTTYNCVTLTQELINRVNLFRSQSPDYSKLHWYPGNPTTKRDGSPFPDLSGYSWQYKSFTDIMNEIWSSSYTEDGDYIWYIKKDKTDGIYYFYVVPKTQEVPEGNIINEDSGEISLDGGYNEDNIANCIIYNYGRDNKGNVLQRPYYNWQSIMKYGPRWRYITLDAESFDAQLYREAQLQPEKFEWDSDGRLKSRYPSYSFTFSFTDEEGNPVTVNNDDEFNSALAAYCDRIAREKVAILANYLGFGKASVKIKYLAGQANIDLGSLYNVNAPSRGIFNQRMRVIAVEHDYYYDTFELQADTGT